MTSEQLEAAVARYFEQHARNEKALNDLKLLQKAERDELKESIESGERSATLYALGEEAKHDDIEALQAEVTRRLNQR